MPTTNNLLETINSAITTGSYTTYIPESWTTSSVTTPVCSTIPVCSTTLTPNTIYMSNQSIDETIKEATEKVDKHVDQLEEDIDFLNRERIANETRIKQLISENINKTKQIEDLEKKINAIQAITSTMASMLEELENKVNGTN